MPKRFATVDVWCPVCQDQQRYRVQVPERQAHHAVWLRQLLPAPCPRCRKVRELQECQCAQCAAVLEAQAEVSRCALAALSDSHDDPHDAHAGEEWCIGCGEWVAKATLNTHRALKHA